MKKKEMKNGVLLTALGYEPVFPMGEDCIDDGITKREYIAAMALQGLLAAGNRYFVAKDAVRLTDELLAELNKTE